MLVIKRDGRTVDFDKSKISQAVLKAFLDVDGETTSYAKDKAREISSYIEKLEKDNFSVEEIQDIVEEKLMASNRKDVARSYIIYRNERTKARKNTIDDTVLEIVDSKNQYWLGENSNKNPLLNTTIRDYIAGAVSKDLTFKSLLPSDVQEAHRVGLIHFHDSDYFLQKMHNCDLVNAEDMLQNGTVISETMIEKPHSFSTACTVLTQIIAQVASFQYGGQSVSLAHLAPFVDISRQSIKKDVIAEQELIGTSISESDILKIVNRRLKKEISKGIQTIQYQITTLMTTNGQAPFLSLFMYLGEAKNEQEKEDLAMLIEEVLDQSLQGVKNKIGEWSTPAFPKILYVTDEDNIYEDSKYWHLTEKAINCSLERLTPDYISAKKMKELKENNVFPCMGCRSFLSPWKDEDENYKFYGRFNQGVVTLSLPFIALESKGDINKFWELMESSTEICHKALMCRHRRLEGTSTKVAPILWQYGALARLGEDETINKLLHGGYSSISLGYAGLYECVKFMTGSSHSDESVGEKFGLEIMRFLNKKCDEWSEIDDIAYGVYGTPLEATTERFAKCLKDRFGVVEGITDRSYITNSYHIPVFEKIDAYNKLRIESKFQELSLGGSISYIELPNMKNNIQAVKELVQYMYETNLYAEINTKPDYCYDCGFKGEINLIDNNNQLIWECPNCKNRNVNRMDITRRTCGYKGTARNGWNQGRLGDIHDRINHLDDVEYGDM